MQGDDATQVEQGFPSRLSLESIAADPELFKLTLEPLLEIPANRLIDMYANPEAIDYAGAGAAEVINFCTDERHDVIVEDILSQLEGEDESLRQDVFDRAKKINQFDIWDPKERKARIRVLAWYEYALRRTDAKEQPSE